MQISGLLVYQMLTQIFVSTNIFRLTSNQVHNKVFLIKEGK